MYCKLSHRGDWPCGAQYFPILARSSTVYVKYLPRFIFKKIGPLVGKCFKTKNKNDPFLQLGQGFSG